MNSRQHFADFAIAECRIENIVIIVAACRYMTKNRFGSIKQTQRSVVTAVATKTLLALFLSWFRPPPPNRESSN